MNWEHNSRVQLRHWVLAKNGKIRPEELDDHTPILEQRIITSLQVMDLILFLEQLTGKPIEVEMLQPGAFRSIETLYQHFCAAEAPNGYQH
jgi:acyl carrier protein